MKQFSLLGLGVLFFAFLALFSPSPSALSASSEFVPGELLVSYKQNIARTLHARSNAAELATGDTLLDALNQQLGVKNIAPLFRAQTNAALPRRLTRIFKIKLADEQDVRAAATQYALDPKVEFAEPNYIARAIVTPNDAEFAQQWGLTKISAPSAWDTTTGNSAITIAIIDSGMDKTHADMASKLWVNPGEVAGNSIDDDANGYVDDVNGWNFVASNNNPNDDNGHGTLVAGIAGAATNNSIGVAGVCWQCKLMPVKVMNAGGSANYSDIALGVLYAAQKGAKVINLSLGGNADSQTLHTAIQSAANDYTSVVVAGAGNDNSDALFYPAAYDEVLAVAGTDESEVRVSTSNYGAWVDVSAPGQDIRTTASGGGYATNSGTSLAAPFAAGLAGLLRSQNPSWSQALVRAQIINTTDSIDAANPSYVGQLGSGRINAANAMTTNGTPLMKFVNYGADGETNAGIKTVTNVVLTVTLRNDWKDAASVQATLSTNGGAVTLSDANANYGALASGESKTNTGDTFQISVTSGLYGHVIPFTLSVNADGNHSQIQFNATTESAVVNVGGTIASDTVWTSDYIYNVTSNVSVSQGKTLTIEPGTTIKFNKDRAIIVNGTLVADGSTSNPIRFTSAVTNPQPGDWGIAGNFLYAGIIFSSTSQPAILDVDGNYVSGSILRHAIVEYSKGIELSAAAPLIESNFIQRNDSIGPILYSGYHVSAAKVRGNVFTNNHSGQHFIFLNGTTFSGNLLSNNSALYGMIYGDGIVKFNTITENTVDGNGCLGGGSAVICLAPPNSTISFVNYNNIFRNSTLYDLGAPVNSGGTVDATNNYWGTTESDQIAGRILDNYSVVTFTPFLNRPDPNAPAFVQNVTTNPGSPVGIQSVTFDVQFSREMNTNRNPEMSFVGSTLDWASRNAMPTARNYLGAVASRNGNIYAIGGTNGPSMNVVEEYNSTTDTWVTRTNMPTSRFYIGVATSQSKIYVIGGTNSGTLNTVEEYDPTTNTWATRANMPTARYALGVGTSQGRIYAIGGNNAGALNTVEEYDPTTNTWATRASMPTPRFALGVTTYQGKIYAIGGFNNSGYLSTVEEYTPETDTWTTRASMPTPRSSFGLAMGNGKIYVIGGVNNSGTLATVEEYDPTTNIWTTRTSLPMARDGLAAAFSDGKIYAIGGEGSGPGILAIVEQGIPPFDSGALTGQWINPALYRSSYDINSLVPKHTYLINVSSALGTDGIEIVSSNEFSFTVDYAGGITDQTPPTQPLVMDDGAFTASTTQLHASWISTDAQSAITQYQYAIGTSAGGTDVVNWTTPNPATATQVTKSGLLLTNGQKYYIAVRAKNTGGLWSQVGVSDGITVDSNYKTPTPTKTPTATRTFTPTFTRTVTLTNTPTATRTSTPTYTPTNGPSPTPTSTLTLTPTNTPPLVNLGKPKLKNPPNGNVLSKPRVKLDWSDVANATSYEAMVRRDKKTGRLVTDKIVLLSNFTTPKLKPRLYYWHVRACNLDGCGAWSKWWSFKIQ